MPAPENPSPSSRADTPAASFGAWLRSFGWSHLGARPWWIAGGYAVVATFWIYCSDAALAALINDPALLLRWGVYKGMAFVGVTSVMLLLAMRRAFRAIAKWYESYRARELELERFKRLYAALSRINREIVRLPGRDELFLRVCTALVTEGGFRLAWIGWHDPATERLVPVAVAGDENDYIKNLQVYADKREEGRGPSGTAFRENRPYICNDLLTDPATLPWRAESLRRGFRASVALPIRLGGAAAGTLSVYADETGFFRDREIALLAEAAGEIAFALDNLAREESRRAAEVAVRRERDFSEAMLNSLPGVLYLYDRSGRFLRWNRNFERVTGFTAAEITDMSPLDFFAGADRERVAARIGDVFQKGESSVEADFVSKDGRATPYYFTGIVAQLDGQECLVGVGIDITERKEAEWALRELNETLEHKVIERTDELQTALVRAEAADRIKSAFLATMSHELRTPLNSIIGFTGIVLQGLAGPLNPEQTKQLGMVRGSARHLLELINDVLDLSKIEAGQLEVRAEPFDLRESITRVMASVRPQAEKKGLTLDAVLAADLAGMVGDRRRVEQVLINLLHNALKFTERGGVTLTADLVGNFRPHPDEPARPAVRIHVADTGIGIKPEHRAALFQPFRQLDTGLARQHEGTGLGLAICRRLAALMGGEISAASEWGRGSVFTVTLPLQRPSEPWTPPSS